jgi:hypothetical protein
MFAELTLSFRRYDPSLKKCAICRQDGSFQSPSSLSFLFLHCSATKSLRYCAVWFTDFGLALRLSPLELLLAKVSFFQSCAKSWLTNQSPVGTWFAFKHLFRRKAQELERKNLNYGALARLTRDEGFWIVLIIRLSAVPSHFSTAVFSTCDVRFWHFFLSTFLSLPKQVVLVYLGVLLVQNNEDNVIKTVMFGIIFVITIILGVWIYIKMNKVKKVLLDEQEQRRVKKAETVEMVPNVRSAFERRYDDVEPTEFTMVPTQPARML